MIKIENFEVVGWEHAIRGMRNPIVSELINDEVITRLKYLAKRLFMLDFITEYLI